MDANSFCAQNLRRIKKTLYFQTLFFFEQNNFIGKKGSENNSIIIVEKRRNFVTGEKKKGCLLKCYSTSGVPKNVKLSYLILQKKVLWEKCKKSKKNVIIFKSLWKSLKVFERLHTVEESKLRCMYFVLFLFSIRLK